jgi:hypothetical protein
MGDLGLTSDQTDMKPARFRPVMEPPDAGSWNLARLPPPSGQAPERPEPTRPQTGSALCFCRFKEYLLSDDALPWPQTPRRGDLTREVSPSAGA